jgi:hypothetical protein
MIHHKLYENQIFRSLNAEYGLNKNEALQIVSKSLLYSTYDELFSVFQVTNHNGYYCFETIDSLDDFTESFINEPAYSTGFFTSEYLLRNLLSIDYNEAKQIKKKLDRDKLNWPGKVGDTFPSDIEILKYQLGRFLSTNQVQNIINTTWPLAIYGTKKHQEVEFENGKIEYLSFIHFKEFNLFSTDFFGNEDNLRHYINQVMDLFLAVSNVVFCINAFDLFNPNSKLLRDIVQETYSTYPIHLIKNHWKADFYIRCMG